MIQQGQGAARLIGGQTAKTIAQGFITIQTAGIRELAQEFERLASRFGEGPTLKPITEAGAKIIADAYASKVADVTGNLRKSIRGKRGMKTKVYDGATVTIVGPLQTGNQGASEKQGSGNHAWLVEFGSGRRRPGTQGRRTYINVHQMINRRMRLHSSANDEQFMRMSKGYYFLMGSKKEPTRQARMGKGYPHDFGYTDGRMHPITLHPGETYGAMPAQHPMERAIQDNQQVVFNTLKSALENAIKSMKS